MLSRDLWGRLSVRPGSILIGGFRGFCSSIRAAASIGRRGRGAALEQGFSLHAIDGEQVRLLEPALRGDIAAGIHYPSEAHVHP